MRTVAWISRHQPHKSQIAELRRMYGPDTGTCQDVRPFGDAKEILDRVNFLAQGLDLADVVVVAPYSVLDHLCRLGLRPLYAVTEQVTDKSLAEWWLGGRGYRHVEFKRVVRMELVLEDSSVRTWRTA